MQDKILQSIQTFRNTGKWPPAILKQNQAYYTAMIEKLFQDKNKLVWVRLNDFNYPRTALHLPSRYRKKQCARPMTVFSEDTMRLTRRTLKFPLPTFGQKGDKTLSATKTFVYDANKEKINQQTYSAGATTDSGPSKPPDSRRPFWPNAHSGQ